MKTVLALIVYASVSTFRRAGLGFTDKGSAFPADFFNDEQLNAIQKEPKLSIKEVPVEDIPDGVDTTVLDSTPLVEKTTSGTAPEKKTSAAKTESSEGKGENELTPAQKAAKTKAANKAKKDAGKDSESGEQAAPKTGDSE